MVSPAAMIACVAKPRGALSGPHVGVHNKAAFAGSSAPTLNIGSTQASGGVFLLSVQWYGSASVTGVTDNYGNTYSQIQSTVATAVDPLGKAALFQTTNGAGGANHTFTASFSGAVDGGLFGVEVTGAATSSAVDQAPAGLSDTHSEATAYLSALTGATSQASEIALAFAVVYSTGASPDTHTWGNGYTSLDELLNNAVWTGGAAYKLLSATGTQQSALTVSGPGVTSTDAVTFIVTIR